MSVQDDPVSKEPFLAYVNQLPPPELPPLATFYGEWFTSITCGVLQSSGIDGQVLNWEPGSVRRGQSEVRPSRVLLPESARMQVVQNLMALEGVRPDRERLRAAITPGTEVTFNLPHDGVVDIRFMDDEKLEQFMSPERHPVRALDPGLQGPSIEFVNQTTQRRLSSSGVLSDPDVNVALTRLWAHGAPILVSDVKLKGERPRLALVSSDTTREQVEGQRRESGSRISVIVSAQTREEIEVARAALSELADFPVGLPRASRDTGLPEGDTSFTSRALGGLRVDVSFQGWGAAKASVRTPLGPLAPKGMALAIG